LACGARDHGDPDSRQRLDGSPRRNRRRHRSNGCGYGLRQRAPSTALRAVPLPRYAGEDEDGGAAFILAAERTARTEEDGRAAFILPRVAGEGDRAKRGGGGILGLGSCERRRPRSAPPAACVAICPYRKHGCGVDCASAGPESRFSVVSIRLGRTCSISIAPGRISRSRSTGQATTWAIGRNAMWAVMLGLRRAGSR